MCLRASVSIGTTKTLCGNLKAALRHLVQLRHYIKPSSDALHATYLETQGRDSVGSIATGYGLGGLGIEYRRGRDFPHPSRPALGPTHPTVQWVPGLSRRVERPGRGFDHPSSSSAEVKERVDVFLYSTCGPSWPVVG